MTRINKNFPKISAAKKVEPDAGSHRRRWTDLCERFLPVKVEGTIWRYSRHTRAEEPLQGWKLHISATVLEACHLFEKVAAFLISHDVQFKAPESLDELSKINCGLQYGYALLGKFITVYPNSDKQAVEIARRLHELTKQFVPVVVPFDEQFLPESSVFYRYGAFVIQHETTDEKNGKVSAVKKDSGEMVPDNRLQAVPEWLSDPFKSETNRTVSKATDTESPLTKSYRVFRAITQRGKGGTYHAVDISQKTPRFCIVKEGRRYGEIGWDGQDGYSLVKNELRVLSDLCRKNKDVPRVFSSFELDKDFYLVMEFIDGKPEETDETETTAIFDSSDRGFRLSNCRNSRKNSRSRMGLERLQAGKFDFDER